MCLSISGPFLPWYTIYYLIRYNAQSWQLIAKSPEEVDARECKTNLANNNSAFAGKSFTCGLFNLVSGYFSGLLPGWRLRGARSHHLCQSPPGRALYRYHTHYPHRDHGPAG